jgi:hypothetical protein
MLAFANGALEGWDVSVDNMAGMPGAGDSGIDEGEAVKAAGTVESEAEVAVGPTDAEIEPVGLAVAVRRWASVRPFESKAPSLAWATNGVLATTATLLLVVVLVAGMVLAQGGHAESAASPPTGSPPSPATASAGADSMAASMAAPSSSFGQPAVLGTLDCPSYYGGGYAVSGRWIYVGCGAEILIVDASTGSVARRLDVSAYANRMVYPVCAEPPCPPDMPGAPIGPPSYVVVDHGVWLSWDVTIRVDESSGRITNEYASTAYADGFGFVWAWGYDSSGSYSPYLIDATGNDRMPSSTDYPGLDQVFSTKHGASYIPACGAVWKIEPTGASSRITQIDPRSGLATWTTTEPGYFRDILVGSNNCWARMGDTGLNFHLIQLGSRCPLARSVPLTGQPFVLGDSIWTREESWPVAYRVDPATGQKVGPNWAISGTIFVANGQVWSLYHQVLTHWDAPASEWEGASEGNPIACSVTVPTPSPTASPTATPSASPSTTPTATPSASPSAAPTSSPSPSTSSS